MRVKKLEIFGFKSFALKQALTFGEGVTGIVGPNGCGKSNVVDAMRWVMGEQNARHLRGGNMQDIIFCGSEKKAPLGFAEVTLTIDNNQQDAPLEYNHYQEIEITRRLYKTGESEYEINRQKARLKDISDFFLGTGVGTKAYSIIEQGRVNEIISAKPADRRLIIEEAAGITKYKAKKLTAERRMETTRTNLDRIIDIKNEVDKRVASLLKEKEKLEKIQAVKNRIRDIDLHIASHQYLNLFVTLSFLKTKHQSLSADVDFNQREIAVLEHGFATILADYSSIHDQRRLLENLQNQHKTTLELLRKDLDYSKNTLADHRSFLTRIAAQLEDVDQREAELTSDIERFKTEHDLCQAEYGKVVADIAAHQTSGQSVVERRQKNLLDEREIQRRIVEAATKAARLQTEITACRDQEAQKQVDVGNLVVELEGKAEELNQVTTSLFVLDAEYQKGSSLKENLQSKLNLREGDLKEKTLLLAEHKKQLRSLEDEQMRYSSRAKSLKEIVKSCEWSESGIQELLASEHKHLIRGVIAEVIDVKPGFEDAIEKYLAHLLDAAILNNSEDLGRVAHFLKLRKAPETAFLLLGNNDSLTHIAKPIGLKSICDLISIEDPKFLHIYRHFARFFLADNLSLALSHWPAAQMAQATIISQEGEMLLPDGRAIILGQDNGKGVLKRRNEIVELDGKLAIIDNSITEIAKTVQQSETVIKTLQSEKDLDEGELKTLTIGLVRLDESIKQKRHNLAKINIDIKKLEEKRDLLKKTGNLFDEKLLSLNSMWSQALDEHKVQEEELDHIRALKSVVDVEYETYLHRIKEIEILKVGLYEKSRGLAHSLGEAQKNLSHLGLQKKSFIDQADEKSHEELILKEKIRQTEHKLVKLSSEIEETEKMLIKVSKLCTEVSLKKETEETRLHELNVHGHSLQQNLHEIDIRINNVDNNIMNTCDRIKEKYRINLLDHIVDFHLVPLNENQANMEKSDLTKQRDRLGSVNENAAQEYEEFRSRSEFLRTQIEDLNDGLMQLESAIRKINKTTKMRFLEAFHSINQQFSIVFPRLFNGGKAELILSDEEDLLNCGVDIIAKPPGKNISSIELMSGGEKALTAISLIMAIFLIKPSPFCLLDEVDAPLDEANVARFSQLIKEMSVLSQFIVITHNRKTMESADQLYGVTMEDAGQSKIVSVHVQQAFEALRQPKPNMPQNKSKPTQLFLDS